MTATLVSQMGVTASLNLYSDTGGSISLKSAATQVDRLVGYTYCHLRDINATVDGFGTENEDDTLVLATAILPIYSLRETVGNEGDVRRLFFRHFRIIMLGMSSRGIVERSETGPPPPTTTSVTVDVHYVFRNKAVSLVELKRPWAIRDNLWQQGPGATESNKRNLEKEIRM